MAISWNRIHTKDEIRESLEIWFKYREEQDYDFKLKTSVDTFKVESQRVTKFEKMED